MQMYFVLSLHFQWSSFEELVGEMGLNICI